MQHCSQLWRLPPPPPRALQAGGKTLEVPAVEITYGLERILMALQARA